MCDRSLAQVMNRQVFAAGLDTVFREIVCTLVERGLPALPVVDSAGRPAGVVAAADAAVKLEFHGGADLPPLLGGVRGWSRWRKADGLTAAELMTSPAPVMPAGASLHAALHYLADHRLGMLCVADSAGLLVGVPTLRDALRVFLRTDAAIRTDVENQVPEAVSVQVAEGVVTLDGFLCLRSAVDHVLNTAKRVPGVVAVRGNLSYDVDDLTLHGL